MVAALLSGCHRQPPDDTVESIMANPQRRTELQSLCRKKRADMSRVLCRRVAEARRRKRLEKIEAQESQTLRER
ncbi:hypothetical protein CYJ10_24135 [Cupriavidus pauculus]|uniref:Entry exclusion lipoprotein TrbK n=2 Tax=Cupriavidus pauculus TaxID=82633 RepID=A0A2N5C702_9BURK|nr:hypothetical protein CYJ10_24135 [Cupriavidus pauculus]